MMLRTCGLLVALTLALRSLAKNSAINFKVSVSSAGFSPDSLNPREGDVVEIIFSGGSDSLTQSTLDDPCTQNGGVDANGPGTFTYTVKSNTEDMFFFNRNAKTCRDAIFTINVSQGRNSKFQSNAANAAAPNGAQDESSDDSQTVPSDNQPQSPNDNVASQAPDAVDSQSTPIATSASTASLATFTRNPGVLPPAVKNTKVSNAITMPIMATLAPQPSSLGSTISAGAKPHVTLPENPSSTTVDTTGSSETTATTGSTPPSGIGPGSQGKEYLAVRVVGILLGVLVVVAVAILLLIRLLRKRKALLPTTVDPYSKSQSPPGTWFHGVQARFKFAGTSSTLDPKLIIKLPGWRRLEEKEERRVSPFIHIPEPSAGTSTRTFDSGDEIVTRTDSPIMGRHFSQSTLVAGESRSNSQRLSVFSSLFVEASDSGSTRSIVKSHREQVGVVPNPFSSRPNSSPLVHEGRKGVKDPFD